ncbi:efflux RND transporter periplasmic adaptor subunit [Thalassomonas sp. M1454]|uniref:efflux RND transporter periplasmic adaptor subunit n=1 Tax=Thalassomonas sp. M1454 TaxID=2594477 RepID=UPI00117F567B|nr:efflux RND transporter periplasmic adaptor subunit [Thalassomonas sp. M1454]TRX52828.1 efflux RND transporter periplasmic adaptor subunit [Thalassomonas sp. M1454]
MSSGNLNQQKLYQKPAFIAAFISILLLVWLASGFNNEKTNPDELAERKIISPRVKVETFIGESIENTINLYGRTEPDRIVTLQAQVKGAVTKIYANRGSFVKKGDVIATIALNDLPAQLEHYQTLVKQRRIDYYGAKELFKGGYQGESALAERLSAVTAAKAQLAQTQNDIANTTIVAPFDGILNERFVEVGDYLKVGDDIAIVADLDPLVIRAHITENQISAIKEGQKAKVNLLNEREINGQLRYVASVANENTNTFKVEIAIANPGYKYLAGISSEVELPLDTVSAIKVSPALLALDESGNIGVKSVVDDTVVFTQINIAKSDENGVWLTGIGESAEIITLGQGFVRPGDKVNPIREEQ